MIAALRVYTEKYPTDSHVGDALYAIGQQLETDGNTGQALAVYRDLIARAVTNPRGPIRDAAIAAQLRTAALLEPKEAIADCESFLSKFASEPVAVLAAVTEIAALYRKAKLSAEGYAKLEQLAAQYQRNAAVRVAVGIGMIDLAIGEKDYQRAYAAARDLLADPNNGALPASGYLAIGNAMLKVERYAEARDAFAKLLKLYADDTRALPLANLGLGQAELGLRNFDQAEAVFRKLIQTDPDNLDATLGLGKVYEARGNIKEAIATYDAVWRQGRGDAVSEAAFRVGMLAFQQKDYRTALPMFARLLFATGPLADEAAFRAAQCHEALGNIEQARSAYQTYLRRYPNGTFALEARTLLAKLPVPPA
jgi:TolA-binding protein